MLTNIVFIIGVYLIQLYIIADFAEMIYAEIKGKETRGDIRGWVGDNVLLIILVALCNIVIVNGSIRIA